ncbi:hypothetical protein ACF0H5_023480 [Mactra antiquata]
MAMIDNSNIIGLVSRPRRVLQSPSKNYDGEGERNLELRGILDVLGSYRDYDGGINCSKCGKLYKSKVCFIKHLWEHSVYWELFPGDRNHERVLAIQAALILYSQYLGVSQEDAEKLKDLLVTSPRENDFTTSSTTASSSPGRKPRVSSVLNNSFEENMRPYATIVSPVTPEKNFDSKLVCPPAPRKDKRKISMAKSQRSAKRRRKLLLE